MKRCTCPCSSDEMPHDGQKCQIHGCFIYGNGSCEKVLHDDRCPDCPQNTKRRSHPSDGGVAGDDDCEDQTCPPTDRCTKFKCDNAELVLRGKYWRCPNCGASYGEYPFHGGVAGEPVAWRIKTPTGYVRDIFDNENEAAREADGYWQGQIEPLYAAPVPGNEGREAIIEKCAGIVDRWIGDITKAGDQFDKGGDIYSHANVLQGVAASIRGLSHSRSER